MGMEMESLINLTLPSANVQLTPPGWLLVAGKLKPQLPSQPYPQPARQPLNPSELGVWTVLKIVEPSAPSAQRQPRLSLMPWSPGALNCSAQAWRAAWIVVSWSRVAS
jgi:hypothetical protein